jgi:hypothetical protein
MKIALVIFEMKNPFKIGLVIKKLKITRQPINKQPVFT